MVCNMPMHRKTSPYHLRAILTVCAGQEKSLNELVRKRDC